MNLSNLKISSHISSHCHTSHDICEMTLH